jgi:hypothetical protein
MVRIEAEEDVSVFPLISSSLEYINGIQLAKYGVCLDNIDIIIHVIQEITISEFLKRK